MIFKFGWLFCGPSASPSNGANKTVTLEFSDGTTQVLEDALFFHYPEPVVLPWFHLVFKGPKEHVQTPERKCWYEGSHTHGLKMEKFDKPFTIRVGGKEFKGCSWTDKECNFAMNLFVLKGAYNGD